VLLSVSVARSSYNMRSRVPEKLRLMHLDELLDALFSIPRTFFLFEYRGNVRRFGEGMFAIFNIRHRYLDNARFLSWNLTTGEMFLK